MPVGKTKNAVARLHEPHRTLLRQQDKQQYYKQHSEQRFNGKIFEYPDQRYVGVRHCLAVVVEHTKRAFEMGGCRIMDMRCNVGCIMGMYAHTQTLGEQQRQY